MTTSTNKLIDIDKEFDDVYFDEASINRFTAAKERSLYHPTWKKNSQLAGLKRKNDINWQQKQSKRNEELYGNHTWILRSPGNDLLDFYDKQNELLGKENRAHSSIPPSTVYHYRFEHRYPKELFDKSKNYGINAYLRDRLRHLHDTSDPTYWGQVRTKRYDWLVDRAHTEIEFKFRTDIIEYLRKEFGQSGFHLTLAVNDSTFRLKKSKFEHMFWRGKLKGWSIIAIPN
jgi:hypothetical protein